MNDRDTLIELYKTQLEQWNKRRVDEWGITLSLWTSVTVGTGLLAGKVQMNKEHLFGYLIIWLLYTRIWAWNISQANRSDKTWARVYLRKIQLSLSIEGVTEEVQYVQPKWWQVFEDWSFWAKAVFTAGILGLSWYILSVVPIQGCVCP